MVKEKIFKTKKKVLAIILLIITLIGTVNPVFAISGSGSAEWTCGQWDSEMKTTEYLTQPVGILIRKLVNLSTYEQITVFCAQNLTDIKTGTIETGNYFEPTDTTLKKACKIAYLGWYSKHKDYVVDGYIMAEAMASTKKDYVFTQVYVWEVLGQSSGVFVDSATQNEYIAFKTQINNKINNIERRPDFDATTITVDAGETTTITDSNNVLKDYNSVDRTTDGIRVQHTKGENTLKITVSEDCSVENYRFSDATLKSWGLIKDETKETDTTIYFSFRDGVQDQLYAMNYNDPVTMAFSLKINLLGNLELDKLNTNGDLVDGAVFTVSGPGYNGDVTVKDGKITLEKIKKGIYTIKEKSVPTGYLINTNTYTAEVKPNQTTQHAIVNEEPTGEITITKTDIVTGNSNRINGTSHHGDVSIKGAEYTLYAKSDIYNVKRTIKYFSQNDEIAKFTFNEYGVASIKITNNSTPAKISVSGSALTGLPIGSYYSKETIVPNGYTKDTNTYDYTLSYKDSNTRIVKTTGIVKNDVQRAPFEIIKVTTNDNKVAEFVEGAEFTAILTKYVDYYGSFDEALKHLGEYANDEYSIFKTGSNGHGVSGLLAYGNYTIRETYTPSDKIETVEDFFVTIDRDSKTPIRELVANDLPFESYVKLQKQDKETGKVVTFSNATFTLYKLNESTKQWEGVSCKVGNQHFTTWTTNSEGIVRTEIKLPAGTYKVDEIKIPTGFIELDGELTFEISRENPTLNYDEDLDAWITVTVKNSQPVGNLKLNKKVNLRENIDTTLIKNIDFTKISFELIANENIIDYADGSIIYEKGKVVGTYNLKSDGTLEISNLPMGAYYLKEVSTIEGAVLDGIEHEVIFKQVDTSTKEYNIELRIENETTIVEISKQDITGEKEIEGAKLTILDENGEIIDSWISSNNSHTIEGLEVGKTYTLHEDLAPLGYVKSTDITFTIDNTAEIQKVTMVDKVVEMSKLDFDGNEIVGAEMKVIDEEGNVVDEWTSTQTPHIINGLEEGKSYILHEDLAQLGYVKATDITFTVTANKETQEVTMIDKVVEITKKDLTNGEELEGAELVVTDEEGNIVDEWTSNKEHHIVQNLEEGKTYTLTEKTAPYGYETTESITFEVTEDKATQIVEMKDAPILKKVQVEKLDKETNEHIKSNRFVFGIFEDKECTKLIEKAGANEFEGTALFENLRYGTYYIKELEAPTGYSLSKQVVKIVIDDTGVYADDELLEENDEIYSFKYYNSLQPIIQTGSDTNIGLLISLALASLTGIALIIIKKKENKKGEN